MNKVLILSTARNYGGAEKSIEVIVKKLKKNFDVLVAVSNKKYREFFKKNEIKTFFLKSNKIFILYNAIILYKVVKNFNVIVANTNKDAFYLALISFFIDINNKNVLIYMRDHQWKYRKFIYKRMKNAKYILPSKALLDDELYIKKYISEKQFYIIGESVKISNISYKEGEYILLLANISKLKGIDLLLKAYVKSELKKENLKVLICGKVQDKIYFKNLLEFIRQNNIESVVKIKDFQEDEQVKILYENALFVVNSSISNYGGPETFGRTIIEAWSYKKPVIAFNVGGPKYIIDNAIDGFLVEEGNIFELADKIKLLAMNRFLCKKMGENGYVKVKEKYNVDFIYNKFLSCIYNKND